MFVVPTIRTWREVEGSLSIFKLGESSLVAHVLPVTSEHVQHTIPLLMERLVHHERKIQEIQDHLEEIPLERVETVEHDIKILRDRAEAAKQQVKVLHDSLRIAHKRITELQIHMKERMSTTRQGLNSAAIEQLIAQLIANAMTAYEENQNIRNEANHKASGSAGGGTEGAVGLTRWFEKMELVFHIENGQVKYAKCTLMDGALTWWNSYVKKIGLDAAYKTTWKVLKQIIIDEYCPRNEGLTDDIQGNVTSSKPKKIREAIRIDHDLMYYVVRAKAAKNGDNKRKNGYTGKSPLYNRIEGARGRAFVLGGGEAIQDPNMITCTFLLKNRYASVLFDLGADRSFVSTAFSSLINIVPTALDVTFTIELANGKLIGADTII
ncbi:hypothetical protein Tco_1221280 [Tanacetum coccineum]